MQKRLQITSDPKNLRMVENLIEELNEKHQIEADVFGKILVATIEAVNNAIIHGNKSDVNKKVDIDLTLEDKVVKVKICDEGEGFDHEKVPDPTAPENIENIHGRGVFLMKRLSDEIRFNNDGTSVEMTFKL